MGCVQGERRAARPEAPPQLGPPSGIRGLVCSHPVPEHSPRVLGEQKRTAGCFHLGLCLNSKIQWFHDSFHPKIKSQDTEGKEKPKWLLGGLGGFVSLSARWP